MVNFIEPSMGMTPEQEEELRRLAKPPVPDLTKLPSPVPMPTPTPPVTLGAPTTIPSTTGTLPAPTPPVQITPNTSNLSLQAGAAPSVSGGVAQPDFGRVTKPGELPIASEVETKIKEEGFEPSAEVTKAQEAAFGAQEKALKAQAEAQKAGIDAELYARRRMETEKLQEESKVQKQQQEYKKNLANEMSRYDQAYKDLADANKVEVNPRRYLDNMSTASKVMVGLGLLLSGFGGADAVTKSMSIINKAVDDDIAAQKVAREGKIEAAKTGIASIDKKVAQVKDSLKDDMVFDELQRDLRFGAIQSQIEQAITKAKAPEVQAKLEQGLAAIQEKRAENQMKLEQMAVDKVKSQTVTTREAKAVSAPGKALEAKLTPAQKKADESYGKEYADYAAAGGKAGLDNKIKKLETAKQRLQTTKMPSRFVGMLPETAQKAVAPEFAQIGDDVKGAVQETLRQVLGAQFTAEEGERMMNRAFDPALSKEENLRRLDNVINDLKAQAEVKKQAADYYEQMGTLQGFKAPEVKIESPEDEKRKRLEELRRKRGGG